MNILCVLGSNDNESTTALALQIITNAITHNGATAQTLDLRQTPLPLLNPSSTDEAEHLAHVRSLVLSADAFVLSTPDYHGSMSGTLKNFLDHFWGEFAGKTFGYVCSSFDKGLTAMDHVRTCVRQCYGWSLPYGVTLSDRDVVDGAIVNASVEQRLQMLGRDIVVYGGLLTEQRTRDLAGTDDTTFMAKYRGK
jgi:NAD(P)H-dependent FMN reductase